MSSVEIPGLIPGAAQGLGILVTCQGVIMRALFFAIVAATVLAAHPAFAQANRAATTFWQRVQATCNVTAAAGPGELGQRIAGTAIEEFTRFGGHQIDSDGRLFHFGLTEAEHEEDDGGNPGPRPDHVGGWKVRNYWRPRSATTPRTSLRCVATATPRPRRRTR